MAKMPKNTLKTAGVAVAAVVALKWAARTVPGLGWLGGLL